MKKILFLCTVIIGVLAGLSSCSDGDHDRARVLAGEWQGDWGMWYQDDDGYVYDADVTYIRLIPDHPDATYGYGYQEDYYSWDETGSVTSYYSYLWYRFTWTVDHGRIYLTYPYNPDLDAYIRDYRLSLDRFSGYFGTSPNRFDLLKLSDFYAWTPAVQVSVNYGYAIYTGYSRQYEGEAGSKSVRKAPTIVKRGNSLTRAPRQ